MVPQNISTCSSLDPRYVIRQRLGRWDSIKVLEMGAIILHYPGRD